MKFPYNFIAIEGCIGAGKTTLSTKLANDFNGRLILEQFEENDFLPKFYENPERYAFPLELSFLAARYKQFKESVLNVDLFCNFIISDYIFPKSLIFSRKTLQEDEYKLYRNLFQIIDSNLPRPDLILYLHLPPKKLKENIIKRGREYEQNISEEYLDNIQKSYFEYFRDQPSLRVVVADIRGLDFIKNKKHYNYLASLLTHEYDNGINIAPNFSDTV
ncbi:MAG: deoxynucleoside kinase [Bacteroidales bacterium]|nr:deoxynucleoside kinase [Bacteroidales bacterium]